MDESTLIDMSEHPSAAAPHMTPTQSALDVFSKLRPGFDAILSKSPGGDARHHFWRKEEFDCILLALASGRPLLLRGEPGCGKSQTAFAAASVLGGQQPLVEFIHARTEARDLMFHFDQVARLADAQVRDIDPSGKRYRQEGVFWLAIEALQRGPSLPVVLLDEIDKADSEVPNALLDLLGNRGFDLPPYLRPAGVIESSGGGAADRSLPSGRMECPPGEFPLVIITTNEERELPHAFLRRCMILSLDPPQDREGFLAWLRERGDAHTHLEVVEPVRKEAAELLWGDRQACVQLGLPKVGLAEYLDLLTALHRLSADMPAKSRAKFQRDQLQRLSKYVLGKYRPARADDRSED